MPKRKASEDLGDAPKRQQREPEDDGDDDEDENSMDQSQRPDFPVHVAETADDAGVGIIEKISLKNFMCHNRLDVNFLPQVNFIIGANGSGKSAILTALVVGLGGNAKVTNRGSAVKSFIKNGKQVAEVSIRLRNTGLDAYKVDEYGKSITIERRLSHEGASGYKIKSSDGKVVSTKREEILHIMDQFNIQVDNPVSVLNQDTSRNFLHSKSPHDKYKFFLKATQLEQMKHDYIAANESRDLAEDILQQKQESLPSLEKEVYEWEQKFKSLQNLDDLKMKVDKLKNEMAWAFVNQKEKEVAQAQKVFQTEDTRTPKFKQKVEESKNKITAFTTEYKQVQDRLQVLAQQGTNLEPQHQQMKHAVNQKKEQLRKSQMELRKISHDYSQGVKERKAILDRINELKNSAQHNYDAERIAREQKIEELQAKQEEIAAAKHTTEQQRDQFQAAATKYKQDLYRIRNEEKDLCIRLDNTRKNLQNYEKARSNKMLKYGNWMPDLIKAIENASRQGQFHQKPRGPIGANISLREPRWAVAVENCLGGLLSSFCCHDHHDEKVLEMIFGRVCPEGRKPSTITSAFQRGVYDIRANRPRTNAYQTVLEMLEVQDPVIANCLIDQRSVESILLIEDNSEARDIMSQACPQKCNEAFTMVGDQLYARPTFRYYSATKDKAHFLMANIEDDIQNLKEDCLRLENDLKNIRGQVQQLNGDIQKNQTMERQCQTRCMKMSEQSGRIGFEIRELKSREDPAPVDITILEEEVAQYNNQISVMENRQGAAQVTLNQAKAELELADKAFKDIDNQMRNVSESVDPIKEELGALDNKIEQAKENKKYYDQKMSEHQKKLSTCQKEYEVLQKSLEEDIGKASQMCERVLTRRTAPAIDSEIQQILKRIQTEEKNRGNAEEITRRYNETFERYKTIQKEVKGLNIFLKKLGIAVERRHRHYYDFRRLVAVRAKYRFTLLLSNRRYLGKMKFDHAKELLSMTKLGKAMERRHHQYYDFRRMIALRAKYGFTMLLSNRKYTGKMNFDHAKELLTMSVQPQKVKGADKTQDLRSLSGGERSFSTVCFILALWDAMESPFRCLDEFDVFMDMVNRRVAMEMMMDVAKQHKYHQFIFLTPQDMSFMKQPLNGAHIFRMPNPERGQRVLPFRPVNQSHDEEDDDH